MLLYEPDATPFDLRFRLFGVYVRVHPFFWLVSVLFGWDLTHRPFLSSNGMLELALWVVACFVSILLHEFGHVWMGQTFGSHGHIILQGMGGLAVGSTDVASRWKRILVVAAGPGIQLLLWGALYLAVRNGFFRNTGAALQFFIGLMLFINLYWPLFNLLPVYPLDGGQITREVCAGANPSRGVVVSLWVSLIVSAALALNALAASNGRAFLPWRYVPTGMYVAILFALLAVGSWQALQMERMRVRSSATYDDSLPWER